MRSLRTIVHGAAERCRPELSAKQLDRLPGSAQQYRLVRKGRTPAWLSLAWRFALAFGLIGIALAVHWFDRDGLRQSSGEPITLADVLYFTMITVTTVGYGDIVPVTQQARLFDTFVVTPIRLFVWLIFLGTAYDFLLKHVWEKWRMKVIQRNLEGHIVVAGYGTSGTEAVNELVRRGADVQTIVVLEQREVALRAAEAFGATVMEADATRNAALAAARIDRASALVVSAGRDDTSILIVLTARRLAPDVPISVVIRSEDNEPIAQQAGADVVINPASSPACCSLARLMALILPNISRISPLPAAASPYTSARLRMKRSGCRCRVLPPGWGIASIAIKRSTVSGSPKPAS